MVRVMLEPLTQAQRATIPQYAGPMWEAGGGGLGGGGAFAKVVAQPAPDGVAISDIAMAVQIVQIVPMAGCGMEVVMHG